MAKSLRSKWKRKMRAVKREQYSKKELEKLKSCLLLDPVQKTVRDINMTDLEKIATAVTPQQATKHNEKMECDSKIINSKTMKDQHGNFPVWIGSSKLKKNKKKLKKDSKKSNKKKQLIKK